MMPSGRSQSPSPAPPDRPARGPRSWWWLAWVVVAAPLGALLLPAGASGDRWVLIVGAVSALGVLGLLNGLRRGLLLVPRAAWILGFASLLRLLAALGPLRLDDDLWRYLWDGMVTVEGVSPFRFAPDVVASFDPQLDPLVLEGSELAELRRLVELGATPRGREVLPLVNYPFYPTIYPPASQWLFAGAAWLAPGSDTVLRLLLALLDTLSVALLLQLLARLGRPAWWAIAYAWHPLPVLELCSAGHQDALGIFALLAAALALLSVRRTLAGVWLGVAAAVKLFPVGFLWLWLRSLRVRGVAAACAAVLALTLPLVALGPPSLEGLAAYLRQWEFFGGPFALLKAAVGGDARIARALVAVGGLAALVALFPRRDATPEEAVRRGTRWIEILIVLAPVVDPWYVTWALAPTVLCGSLAWPVFAALVPLAYTPHTESGHPWWILLVAWVPFLVLLAREWRDDRRRILSQSVCASTPSL